MSPPIAPAPMTWTCSILLPPPASFFICSRRKNTRIRFCAVGVTISLANEVFSAAQHRELVVAVLFPEIDQRIGRGIMLLRRGLRRPRARMRLASKPLHRAEVQDRIQRPRLGALQAAEHRVLHGIANMPLLRHRIDQPERLRLAGVDGLAGQHQRHRLHRIDQLREARGAAEARMQAEHHFRETKARAVDRDARLAGERDFEAAAEAEAVDHGDGRNLQAFEAVDHRMGAADRDLDRPRIGGAAEFVDVGAGDEAGWFCRADDEAGRPLRFPAPPAPFEFLDQVGRQRVGAGAFAIEQQPGDAVGIAGQLEMPVGSAGLRLAARVRARGRRERP